jgi:hypothetical protein
MFLAELVNAVVIDIGVVFGILQGLFIQQLGSLKGDVPMQPKKNISLIQLCTSIENQSSQWKSIPGSRYQSCWLQLTENSNKHVKYQ